MIFRYRYPGEFHVFRAEVRSVQGNEHKLDLSFILALGLQLVTVGVIYGMEYEKWQNQTQLNATGASTLQAVQTELQQMHDDQIGQNYRLSALGQDKSKTK